MKLLQSEIYVPIVRILNTKQILKGYLNNEAATCATIDDDGFVHSGDVGHYDNDGYFKVVDRTKDLIKVNALQVCNFYFLLYMF